jgi:hypothetical protein
MLPLLSL